MALSIFIPCVTGMEAQSHAMEQVSTNIANMRTVGYKTNETMFYTLLGSNPVVRSHNSGIASSRADINGGGYYDRTYVTNPGLVSTTGQNFDVAINGNGNAFFTLKDSAGDLYYSRAGDFRTISQDGKTYLVSSGGLRVQGFPALSNGEYGAALEDIEILDIGTISSIPTKEMTVSANVPAEGVESSSYGLTVYGPNNDGRTMNMVFSKVEGKLNTWTVNFNIDGAAVEGGGFEAVFDTNGELLSPKNVNLSVNWDDGSNNQIALNIENMTQFDGSSGLVNVKQNGMPSGTLIKNFIDGDGVVKAVYSNGREIEYAKLGVTSFTAPDNLTPINGTLFEANAACGDTSYVEELKPIISAGALEQSTVNVEQEFGRMIQVQRAYTLNTSSFTANNEMLQTVVNLKT